MGEDTVKEAQKESLRTRKMGCHGGGSNVRGGPLGGRRERSTKAQPPTQSCAGLELHEEKEGIPGKKLCLQRQVDRLEFSENLECFRARISYLPHRGYF